MTRPDAKLYELATAIELSAFDKYDIIEHNVPQNVLCVRGLNGNKVIPMRLLYEVKVNDDGSYCKHKCRCILLGHIRASLQPDFDDTYAPTPSNAGSTHELSTEHERFFSTNAWVPTWNLFTAVPVLPVQLYAKSQYLI